MDQPLRCDECLAVMDEKELSDSTSKMIYLAVCGQCVKKNPCVIERLSDGGYVLTRRR